MVRSKYLGTLWGCVIGSINKRWLPPNHLTSPVFFLHFRLSPPSCYRGPQRKIHLCKLQWILVSGSEALTSRCPPGFNFCVCDFVLLCLEFFVSHFFSLPSSCFNLFDSSFWGVLGRLDSCKDMCWCFPMSEFDWINTSTKNRADFHFEGKTVFLAKIYNSRR